MHRRLAVSALFSLLWASRAHPQSTDSLAPSTRDFLDFAATLLRDQLPPQYENWKKWGKTKEVWAGVKVEREGFKIETRRKKKIVNHGSWSMYRIKRIDVATPPDITLN